MGERFALVGRKHDAVGANRSALRRRPRESKAQETLGDPRLFVMPDVKTALDVVSAGRTRSVRLTNQGGL